MFREAPRRYLSNAQAVFMQDPVKEEGEQKIIKGQPWLGSRDEGLWLSIRVLCSAGFVEDTVHLLYASDDGTCVCVSVYSVCFYATRRGVSPSNVHTRALMF